MCFLIVAMNVSSIPECMLPEIVSSSMVYGEADNEDGLLNGVKIAGILGDQQVPLPILSSFKKSVALSYVFGMVETLKRTVACRRCAFII